MSTEDVDFVQLAKMVSLDTDNLISKMKENSRTKRKAGGIGKRAGKMQRVARLPVASLLHEAAEVVTSKEGLSLPMSDPQLATTKTFNAKLMSMHSALARAMLDNAGQTATHRQKGLLTMVPVSTTDHDNIQLEWGRGVPLCAAGGACEATKLPRSRGPLHMYCPPTCDGGEPTMSTKLCLLCIRLHSEMLCKELVALQPEGAHLPSSLLPPFTNIVNAPGGYNDWSLGVSANNHGLFDRQCSIVGASPLLEVRHSPLNAKWRVCQDRLIWYPTPPDFRNGAQEM